MIIGPGIGIKGSLLNLGSVRKPTILMEYNSEEIMTGRSGEDDIRTFSRKRLKSNYRIPLKTSKQITEHEIREN